MSTRCMIDFKGFGTVQAKIYRHSDGYPDGEHGVLADLQRFFSAVEAGTPGKRFSDAQYLAAKFVVWQASQYAQKGPLDFLSVGISLTDHADIEYKYTVDCDKPCANLGRPTVTHLTAAQAELSS